MAHMSSGGWAVLSVFILIGLVIPFILIKFWSPKYGPYGRRGKRDWDDDDQYDRRRRKKNKNPTPVSPALAHLGNGERSGKRGGREAGEQEDGIGIGSTEANRSGHVDIAYQPIGDAAFHGVYNAPPASSSGQPMHFSWGGGGGDQNRNTSYLSLSAGMEQLGFSDPRSGTPGCSTPAPRYTPGEFKLSTNPPYTPSGLRCATGPHDAHVEGEVGAAQAGMSTGGHTSSSHSPSDPLRSGTNWIRRSTQALRNPLDLVTCGHHHHHQHRETTDSSPSTGSRVVKGMRSEEILGGRRGGGETGTPQEVQRLGEWKSGVPLRPLSAIIAHPERSGISDYPPQLPASSSYFSLTPQPPLVEPGNTNPFRSAGMGTSGTTMTAAAPPRLPLPVAAQLSPSPLELPRSALDSALGDDGVDVGDVGEGAADATSLSETPGGQVRSPTPIYARLATQLPGKDRSEDAPRGDTQVHSALNPTDAGGESTMSTAQLQALAAQRKLATGQRVLGGGGWSRTGGGWT